jgi:hypothetical protein
MKTQGDSDEESSASAKSADPPFDGYDRLNERHVTKELSKHTQAELAVIEDYERAHKNRVAVLDKLRYMRGRQPIEGYDDLSPEQIVAGLEEADVATIKEIRDYERKFANRPDILTAVGRVHHHSRQANPAAAPPAYQSASSDAARTP